MELLVGESLINSQFSILNSQASIPILKSPIPKPWAGSVFGMSCRRGEERERGGTSPKKNREGEERWEQRSRKTWEAEGGFQGRKGWLRVIGEGQEFQRGIGVKGEASPCARNAMGTTPDLTELKLFPAEAKPGSDSCRTSLPLSGITKLPLGADSGLRRGL